MPLQQPTGTSHVAFLFRKRVETVVRGRLPISSFLSVHLTVPRMLRRRAFSMPAHIRKKENEERVREKGGNGERHSAYVYIMHIYKAYIHQLGIMKGGRKGKKGKSVHLIWALGGVCRHLS